MPAAPFYQAQVSDYRSMPRSNTRMPQSQTHSKTTSTSPSRRDSTATTAYAASTYSTSSTSTSSTKAPLLSSDKSSRSSRAWSKTKSVLKSLGEPPTAAYDREQMRSAYPKLSEKEIEEKMRREAVFGGMAYNGGPFGEGGMWGQGSRRL